MTDFNYTQRVSTPEWDNNYEATFGKKDNSEEGHEDTIPGSEESGDE